MRLNGDFIIVSVCLNSDGVAALSALMIPWIMVSILEKSYSEHVHDAQVHVHYRASLSVEGI